MSTDTSANEQPQSTDPEQIEAEIEAKRDELSATVDALGQKLDVKSQSQEKVAEIRQRAQDTWQDPQARSEALKTAAPALGAAGLLILLVGVARRARS